MPDSARDTFNYSREDLEIDKSKALALGESLGGAVNGLLNGVVEGLTEPA